MGDAYFKTRAPGVCIKHFCILDAFHHSMYLLYMQEQLSKPRQEHHQLLTGMWITADFRLYPPVITANQELVSPTGDHR